MKTSKIQDCELHSTAIQGTACVCAEDPGLCQQSQLHEPHKTPAKFYFVANEMSTLHWIFLVQAVK